MPRAAHCTGSPSSSSASNDSRDSERGGEGSVVGAELEEDEDEEEEDEDEQVSAIKDALPAAVGTSRPLVGPGPSEGR